MSIGEIVNRITAKYPENKATVSVYQNIRWIYREFPESVDQVARWLMGFLSMTQILFDTLSKIKFERISYQQQMSNNYTCKPCEGVI